MYVKLAKLGDRDDKDRCSLIFLDHGRTNLKSKYCNLLLLYRQDIDALQYKR